MPHFKSLLLVSLFSLFHLPLLLAQSPQLENYVGGWSGVLEYKDAFSFDLTLEQHDGQYTVFFDGSAVRTAIPLIQKGNYYQGVYEDQVIVKMQEAGQGAPVLFVYTGNHLCHVKMTREEVNVWTGNWKLLIYRNFHPRLYLSLDRHDDGSYSASTFFKEPSLRYMYGVDFKSRGNFFTFRDVRSNIDFLGELKEDQILLKMRFLGEYIPIELNRLDYEEWQIGTYSKPVVATDYKKSPFAKMIQAIYQDTLEGTHAVVLAQDGVIIFEHYFDGFGKQVVHDTRSLSKSIAGALAGIAIEQGIFPDERAKIKDYLGEPYPGIDWSGGKGDITLHHLMTMSSGLDAIDFGLKRMSYANEGAYQNTEDWTQHILSAPMVYLPGSQANYGSGSPHLIGACLEGQLNEPMEFFIHKNLMQLLDIQNYRIQTDNRGVPYLGGGWYFTPEDLVKFGQVYLNEGMGLHNQVLSQEWTDKSMQQHTILANAMDKNPYGYLFYHKSYTVGDNTYDFVEGRGSGGQYLFICPKLKLSAVITSGNYRNRKGFQPERIMEEFILPVLVGED